MKNHHRIAIVSNTLPPDSNGQALVLQRILEAFDADSYCLISPESCPTSTLTGKHIKIRPGKRLPRVEPLKLPIDLTQLWLNLRWWSHSLAKIVRQEECTALVACTGEVYELPAAARAAAEVGLPFFPYIFDWYAYKYSCLTGWQGRAIRRYARRVEGPMLRSACEVLVPNESLQKEYWERHGVRSRIVRNPTDFSVPPTPAFEADLSRGAICYTGAIYQAQMDSFTRLLCALKQLEPSEQYTLEVYTDATQAWLDAHGLTGPIRRRERVPLAEVQLIQQAADILFLPLAFHSPYPDIVRTSAPGKMGDYLASGRPILVHAPADSFISWYFRKYDCGIVVDEESPERLTEAIRRISSDGELRRRVASNALVRADCDFHIEHARQSFAAAVGLLANISVDGDERRPSRKGAA